MNRLIPAKVLPSWLANKADSSQRRFYPTHPIKFIVLTLSTLTLYEWYWLYRNWAYVRATPAHQAIKPFWRAMLSVVWLFSLADQVFGKRLRWLSATLFFVYVTCSVLSLLPAPGWLFAFGALAALLPLVQGVNRLNADNLPPSYARFNVIHKAVTAIGLPIMLFVIIQALAVVPTMYVFDGDRLFPWHQRYLAEVAELKEDERVLRFYSDGFLSIAEDGNYFTDRRVVSYWKERGVDEVAVEQADYRDISAVKADFAEGTMRNSKIKITRKDGSFFFLIVTNRRGADDTFFDYLHQQWLRQRTEIAQTNSL